MNDSSYVLLWLEGYFQAWGHNSRFNRRDCGAFPTKSGIVGLVLTSLGIGHGPLEDRWLEELRQCQLHCLGFRPSGPPPQRLTDFHMVGSGYDSKDKRLQLFIPKTSASKKAVGGGSKLTYRYYLQDHVFAVALQIPQQHQAELEQGLRFPIRDTFLGRKNCPPKEFVFQGVFPNVESCFTAARRLAQEKKRQEYIKVLQDDGLAGGERVRLNDEVVSFVPPRRYELRKVSIFWGEET